MPAANSSHAAALALLALGCAEATGHRRPSPPRNWQAAMNEVVGPLYEAVLAPALDVAADAHPELRR